jgi:nitrogen fixation protein NifU and related proteins
MMDRQEQIEILLDHYEHPRHRHSLDPADVTMPGGNPGCGDVITVYLRVDGDGDTISDVSFEGEGCTISQAAASILMEMVHDEEWSLQQVVDLDYNLMIDILGKEAVQMRPRCATLALGTLKAAIRKYWSDQRMVAAGLMDVDAKSEEFGIVTGEAASRQGEGS